MLPQKLARFLSPPSSSTVLSASPWVFDIEESSQTAAARQRTILTLMKRLELHEKGVIRFKKQGKLNPLYNGPFKILDSGGPMAYRLDILEELSNVHSTFHISNLKKCLSDESLVIPMKELHSMTNLTLWKNQ
ncbi:hypothetical protein Tco_1552584 [Tanacetum coccineum]